MCGIIGYIGKNAAGRIVDGLSELEIRGYDSAGMAVWNGHMNVMKDVGYVKNVFNCERPVGDVGIGHTRWATHGKVNAVNAHPHLDCNGDIAVCHNGVIENFELLKSELGDHKLVSETDTEVIAHLIERALSSGRDLATAICDVADLLAGENSFAVLCTGKIIVSCGGPPLLVAPGEVASDAIALCAKNFIRLRAGDVVEILEDAYHFHRGVPGEEWSFYWNRDTVKQNSYPTMFVKEIFEQPLVMKRALAVESKDLEWVRKNLSGNVILSGAGSSKVACFYAKKAFQRAGLNVEVLPSGELETTPLPKKPFLIAVTQSGETETVLHVARMVKQLGGSVAAVVNVPWSSLAAMSDVYLTLNCGAEISVIASKSFISECVVLGSIAAFSSGKLDEFRDAVRSAADALERWLPVVDEQVKQVKIERSRCFVCGEGEFYPVAHEGAMKLKEGALVFAEPMIASEFKHEALPLIGEGEVVIWVGERTAGGMAQVAEIRSRGAMVIGISVDDLGYDLHIKMPEEASLFSPIAVVPLQLLTHYLAAKKGINEDRPRHLAKAITVK